MCKMEKKRFGVCLVCACCLAMGMMTGAEEIKRMGSGSHGTAMRAYELRMNGRLDEAMTLLEHSISENSSDAGMHYELARSYYHKGLGNPQTLVDMLKESQACIEKAVERAPDRVVYHTFSGHVAFMRGYYYLMTNGDKTATQEQFQKAREGFTSALRLKPDYKQAMLYLVELNGEMSEDTGANRELARKHASKLEELDPVFAAKAKSLLSPQDLAFWKDIVERHPTNTDALEELGKAYLNVGEVDDAVLCFEKAVKSDPQKGSLFLDLSIYHTFAAMRAREDQELMKRHATAGNDAVTKYLGSKPIQPMQAYALGIQSKYTSHLGDREQGNVLFEQAKALDPYFSKATGCPIPDLFIPPGTVSQHHRYLGRRY